MRFKILTLLSAVCTLFGCHTEKTTATEQLSLSKPTFRSVEVDEFEKAIADPDVVRLDVRRADEYADGHIKDALNIDVLEDSFEAKACSTLPKDKVVALYCRSGRRSKKAAEILSAKGYEVVELNTGYLGWTGAGKATTK